ncbi:PaaI family thioesterase [Psychrobacillus sp. NEAU-3TGS]|uniref:PaaI family thioesterase n=1 Tax=Psychrobacillus sp. NEAU-3TGS TaxID=2995412 RepID=UPI00249809BA|nr:PaaI family thioesterase [Psychrobacillus sp. NEAU-3TGS]MDI2587535.1 PaaI family thioesterase [Psychrobacillus sp. NEAU-3TGS]
MESNKIEQIHLIQNQLKNLNDDELNQISYLLSLYQASSTEQQETKTPMHFLGRFLGIEQKEDGTTEMNLGIQNENTYGVAQGGSIYTLADVAIGFQILKTLEEGEKVFTLELKVNFIKKGQGARLIAIPSILYQGKTTVVSECDVKDDAGNLIAKALGTFYLQSAKASHINRS